MSFTFLGWFYPEIKTVSANFKFVFIGIWVKQWRGQVFIRTMKSTSTACTILVISLRQAVPVMYQDRCGDHTNICHKMSKDWRGSRPVWPVMQTLTGAGAAPPFLILPVMRPSVSHWAGLLANSPVWEEIRSFFQEKKVWTWCLSKY